MPDRTHNPPMTPAEARTCLADAGLSIRGMARVLGTDKRLLCKYLSGEARASAAVRWVLRYLAARGRGEEYPDVSRLGKQHRPGRVQSPGPVPHHEESPGEPDEKWPGTTPL